MRVVDVFMAMPTIFFVLVILYVIGTSTFNLIAVMSIARWMLYCRLVRALVLSMREQTFVRAARALGASDLRIMTRHLVPEPPCGSLDGWIHRYSTRNPARIEH